MLDAIIRGALRQRLIVLVSSLALLIAGIFVVRDMPVDIFPDLTAPTVTPKEFQLFGLNLNGVQTFFRHDKS